MQKEAVKEEVFKVRGRRNLSQAVAEELLNDIRSGRYRPGDRLLPERELMQKYSVGRNTLREAIQSLVGMGLLDARPGRGTTLRNMEGVSMLNWSVGELLSGSTIEELTEFRLVVETDAAAKAATRATSENIRGMWEALARYEEDLRVGSDDAIYASDLEFHRSIAAGSQNSFFTMALNTTASSLLRTMRAADATPGALEVAAKEHARIANCVASGDARLASEAMRDHILALGGRRLVKPRPIDEGDTPADGALARLGNGPVDLGPTEEPAWLATVRGG